MKREDSARRVAREAARWLTLLESGRASVADHDNLRRWREHCPTHEQTWQKAQLLRQRFDGLPNAVAMASLDRVEVGRREVLKRALALAALAPAGWLAYRELPVANWRADLRTATGERRELRLADGSLLRLNTASAVDLDFRDGQRRLTLVDGEIDLDSAGDLPLDVGTREGRILAGQAHFCVRQLDQGCLVSVSSGSVQLLPLAGPAITLGKGQRARLGSYGVTGIEPFDSTQPGWQQGVLMVDNQKLGDFLRELDRYRPGLLRWDPALESLAVTGTFRLDDTGQVLDLLAASLPLEVHYRTRYWVSLVPRTRAG
ncbi:DUF4880 domain-containing protein [Pseudomonas sp. BN417]|uniref:FecR domain-containing protein n=1 Tax=Pseudomonas sp. BN417 TaxID=2567890 RepID=UPI0024544A67|nr:FecR domain-containing protein [Pseudomonas sp. BN417]MDH4555620.1 DUF4880 domain-containing protein [Pseudomonas sp. BN417]